MAESFSPEQLIYPPHPAVTWDPRHIHKIAGFIAQYKYDDWRALIYFLPDGEIRFFSRKKAKLPRFKPPATLLNALKGLDLPLGSVHVLDGGLIHYKTERVRNTIVLWDLLVHNGQFLKGVTYRERYKTLKKICGNPTMPVSLKVPVQIPGEVDGGDNRIEIALKISKELWLAQWLTGNFKTYFARGSQLPEIEGLVLKDPNAKLEKAFKMEENARWQIRIRKPRIDYSF